MTAYMLWLQDARSEIKADNPGISMIDISRKAGTLWKTLPSIDKKVCTYVRTLYNYDRGYLAETKYVFVFLILSVTRLHLTF